MEHKKGPLADILSFYSEATGELITYLMANEKFMESFQKFLVASVEFRDFMRKATQALLVQLKLPSGEELSRVEKAMNDMEDRLYAIEEKLEDIDARLESLMKAKKNEVKSAPSKRTKKDAT